MQDAISYHQSASWLYHHDGLTALRAPLQKKGEPRLSFLLQFRPQGRTRVHADLDACVYVLAQIGRIVVLLRLAQVLNQRSGALRLYIKGLFQGHDGGGLRCFGLARHTGDCG